MPRAKVAISLDEATLAQLDRLVAHGRFPSRSRAVQLGGSAQVLPWTAAELAARLEERDPCRMRA